MNPSHRIGTLLGAFGLFPVAYPNETTGVAAGEPPVAGRPRRIMVEAHRFDPRFPLPVDGP